MRYINIDLSSDNYLQQPNLFGGYEGEHNETILQVKLPKRMIDIECSGYRFDFQTSEDNKISSPLIPISELNNDILSFHLTQQLTIAGKLLFNVIAILSDENTVSMISKTNTVTLRIEDAVDGNMQLIDPNGYKDELQKMVDERIMEINPANVDQTYNPTSENAQSGKAISQALSEFEQQVDEIKVDLSKINSADLTDVGKVLMAKTVDNGKVTDWGFCEAGDGDSEWITIYSITLSEDSGEIIFDGFSYKELRILFDGQISVQRVNIYSSLGNPAVFDYGFVDKADDRRMVLLYYGIYTNVCRFYERKVCDLMSSNFQIPKNDSAHSINTGAYYNNITWIKLMPYDGVDECVFKSGSKFIVQGRN